MKLAYYSRSHLHLRDLPENHLKRVKEVPFAFNEYRVALILTRPIISFHAFLTKEPLLNVSTTMELRELLKYQIANNFSHISSNAFESTNILEY
jgi:hypothetical protein